MRQDLPTQTLRGLACVLLVLYHVIGSNPSFGLQIADGGLRVLNDVLAPLRMPLFTVLSGWVYGLRPAQGDAAGFLRGKARRLLLPMLFVGTMLVAAQTVVPGANAAAPDWTTLHLLPVGHLWFVESLFWVFGAVLLLERSGCLRDATAFAITWLVTAALTLVLPGTPWLGLEGALYLLPYFLAGLALRRFAVIAVLRRQGLALVLLALAAALALLAIGEPLPDPARRTVPMLVAGLSGCMLLMALQPRCPPLASLGQASYAIYLYHVFFTAGARVVFNGVGVTSVLAHCTLGLAAGLLGPVLIRRVARAHPWSLPVLLGEVARQRGATGTLRKVQA
ncbi:MAG: acyltransferase [Burkholderiaceae bacterium]|nr:acyltransferase [Rhodoferax sp.]MCP5284758.1 acyltransferase [Burkholderiaceae bacterium]